MDKENIDTKYIGEHNELESEFFDIIEEGMPSQHRILKAGKSIDEFNLLHAKIWQKHQSKLVASGFLVMPLKSTDSRDLEKEFDNLKLELTSKGVIG